jgi:uncharacterized membrane protein
LNQEKTSLEQGSQGRSSHWQSRYLGLVAHLLHVVVVMMVVMVAMVVAMMMVMTMMMPCHRGRIRARCTDHRHRESKRDCKPEGREEGLLHGIVSFFRGQM